MSLVATCPSRTGGGRYGCCLPEGHTGRHRASGNHTTWDDPSDAQPEPATMDEAVARRLEKLALYLGTARPVAKKDDQILRDAAARLRTLAAEKKAAEDALEEIDNLTPLSSFVDSDDEVAVTPDPDGGWLYEAEDVQAIVDAARGRIAAARARQGTADA